MDALSNTIRLPETPQTAGTLEVPSDGSSEGVRRIATSLRQLLADGFALHVKTKNLHWHIGGPHYRDYHMLLDEQTEQIFAITDDTAERVRKLGGLALHSIGDIAQLQRLKDDDREFVPPREMLV